MNRITAGTYAMPSAIKSFRDINEHKLLIAAAVLAAFLPAVAQMGGTGGGELQQKLAAVKQSAAENQQKLHKYQWTETTQLTLKGEPKPPTESMCRYGPDGTVQKTQISAPPPPPSGGRLKQHVVEKKKEEMKDYMGQVKGLLAMYVPPDPQRMQQAFQTGKVSLTPGGTGMAQLVFRDYALPGDQMTLSFNTAARKISSVNVNTYMDEPKDTVTLTLHMASLPDGTNYVQQSLLDATAKKLQVTTTSSNYQPIGGY
jgi:hypothetical protein